MESSAEPLYESCQTALNTDSMRMLLERAQWRMKLIEVAHCKKEQSRVQQQAIQRA